MEQFFYYLKTRIELFEGKTDENKEQLIGAGLSVADLRLLKLPIAQVLKAL
jgi:hypothetical protein